jgi:hypothetical protein
MLSLLDCQSDIVVRQELSRSGSRCFAVIVEPSGNGNPESTTDRRREFTERSRSTTTRWTLTRIESERNVHGQVDRSRKVEVMLDHEATTENRSNPSR